MAIKNFEVTPANVKSRIDSVEVDEYSGQVTVNFAIYDDRIDTAQVGLAQFLLSGGSWTDMSINASGVQKDVDIQTTPRWKSFALVWDAYKDVPLENHTGVTVKIQVKDSDGTNDDAQTYSNVTLNFLPVVDRVTLPASFDKDSTPIIEFEVPTALERCNMHFQIVISANSDLSNPTQTIDSSADQTGWQFEIEGNYENMLALGCPDQESLQYPAQDRKPRCKNTLQTPLTEGTWYYEVTVLTATKKSVVSELGLTPEQMTGYPCNY